MNLSFFIWKENIYFMKKIIFKRSKEVFSSGQFSWNKGCSVFLTPFRKEI